MVKLLCLRLQTLLIKARTGTMQKKLVVARGGLAVLAYRLELREPLTGEEAAHYSKKMTVPKYKLEPAEPWAGEEASLAG